LGFTHASLQSFRFITSAVPALSFYKCHSSVEDYLTRGHVYLLSISALTIIEQQNLPALFGSLKPRAISADRNKRQREILHHYYQASRRDRLMIRKRATESPKDAKKSQHTDKPVQGDIAGRTRIRHSL
jgi:hypothetical protein